MLDFNSKQDAHKSIMSPNGLKQHPNLQDQPLRKLVDFITLSLSQTENNSKGDQSSSCSGFESTVSLKGKGSKKNNSIFY